MNASGPDGIVANSEADRVQQAPKAREPGYDLRLYVLGASYNSRLAVERTRQFCERHLSGRYSLTVIDLYQHPGVATRDGIIATPTLVRKAPLPLRRLIGDLTNIGAVLAALGVVPAGPARTPARVTP